MPSLSSNGLTIEYERDGAGEPLLLIMGLAGQLVTWPDHLINALVAEGFDVIRFDNRDAGLSSKIDAPVPPLGRLLSKQLLRLTRDAPYDLEDMADDTAGVLDALGLASAHIAGASMGGMIAQTFAIKYPDRTRSLTSIMSNTGDGRHGAPSPRLAKLGKRMATSTRASAVEDGIVLFKAVSGPSFDEAEARRITEANINRSYRPDGAFRQVAAIMASPDRTKALQLITAPTLVVHGLADTLVRPSGGIATAAAVPGSRLLMFPEMGHNLPQPRSIELAGAIAATSRRQHLAAVD